MLIFRSCVVFSSLLKTLSETCFSSLTLRNGKVGFMQITLTAKSCGVPFVLSFASLSFYSDAGTSEADGFYLDVDE